MEFSIKSSSSDKQRSACVIVGVYESRKLTSAASALDALSQGYLSDLLKRGDMEGRLGTTCLLHKVPGTLAERVLLVGLGRERELNDKAYLEAVNAAFKTLHDSGAADAAFS